LTNFKSHFTKRPKWTWSLDNYPTTKNITAGRTSWPW